MAHKEVQQLWSQRFGHTLFTGVQGTPASKTLPTVHLHYELNFCNPQNRKQNNPKMTSEHKTTMAKKLPKIKNQANLIESFHHLHDPLGQSPV